MLEMAEFCANLDITQKAANDLANRWFQPLTHVSGSQRRPVPLGFRGLAVNVLNAKSAESAIAGRTEVGTVCSGLVLRIKRAGMTRQTSPGPDQNERCFSNG